MAEDGAVQAVLRTLVDGWNMITVRVKQDGKMQFLPLGDIRDQRLVYKIILDLLKQAVAEQGIQLRRSRGGNGFLIGGEDQDIKS